MQYEEIKMLLRSNTTIKLLTADNAPLIISFFFQIFKHQNYSSIVENEITSKLDDHLYQINQPVVLYPKTGKSYLASWTQDGTGFLRKYYETDDEPLYELTPATEIALKWIEELNKPEFVGTESRLKLLFDILKELSVKTKEDAESRIKELELKKIQIELEIENAKSGYFDIFDETQIKERFFNAEETAKRLLSDFRQVEQNFRDIDIDFRRKIITTSNAKGKVLDNLFQQQDFLWETDQGKSFKAFWDFLMSQSKQQELETLLEEVLTLPQVMKLNDNTPAISGIKNNLIEAGDKVNKSTGTLLEQLRKYVEHKAFFENKRIHDNINHLLKIISDDPGWFSEENNLIEIDGVIKLDLIMGRPLYDPPQKIYFSKTDQQEGVASNSTFQLFDQFYVDPEILKGNIKEMLKSKSQVTLKEIVERFGVKKGVTEVIGYVEIAAKDKRHIHDDSTQEEILVSNSKTGKFFKINIPQIIFCR